MPIVIFHHFMSITCYCVLRTSHLKHLKKTFDWKRQLIHTPSPSFFNDCLAIITLSLHYCYCYSIAYHAAIEATHHVSHRSVLLFLLPPYHFSCLLLVSSYMLNPWIPFIAINQWTFLPFMILRITHLPSLVALLSFHLLYLLSLLYQQQVNHHVDLRLTPRARGDPRDNPPGTNTNNDIIFASSRDQPIYTLL